MDEYIEREKMLEDLRLQFCKGCINHFEIKCKSCSVDDVIGFVEDLPTADVVEVVKVAEILNNAFGNDCPCNFKNIDEWLPYVCEYADTCDCSYVKCWEQLIKHYGERRCEE